MNRGSQFQPKGLVMPTVPPVQMNNTNYKPDMPVIQPGPFYAESILARAAQEHVVPPQPPPQKMPVTHTNTERPMRGGARKQRLLVSVLIGGVLLVVLSAVVGSRLLSRSAPNVTLYTVSTGTVSDAIGGGGIVFPRQQLDISYPEVERVVSVLVKAGDDVKANQSLIQLDPSQLNAQVTQAANDLAAAQSYLNTVSVNGNALAIAQAQQSYNVAKNKYEALVAEASSPTLHQGLLISPMSGVVTTINVNPGEVFAANTPLLTLMDESSVIVHVKIPLANLGQVQVGQSATVVPSALPNLTVAGKVVSVVPKADPQTDTFEAWVEVPNQTMMLLPGMSAFVRIQGTQKQAMVLPRLAVLDADHQPTVFVVREEQAHLQRVHIVGRSVVSIYVDGGIHVGEHVVLVGVDDLNDGQYIHVTRVEG